MDVSVCDVPNPGDPHNQIILIMRKLCFPENKSALLQIYILKRKNTQIKTHFIIIHVRKILVGLNKMKRLQILNTKNLFYFLSFHNKFSGTDQE